jgi:hypothetical protein
MRNDSNAWSFSEDVGHDCHIYSTGTLYLGCMSI